MAYQCIDLSYMYARPLPLYSGLMPHPGHTISVAVALRLLCLYAASYNLSTAPIIRFLKETAPLPEWTQFAHILIPLHLIPPDPS